MHELFRLDASLPVPPGESPFQIRGIYYDRLLAHFRKQPGGLSAVLAAVADPRVVAFAEQRFSWLGWYDVLPAMPLCLALAPGVDFEKEVRERTRTVAGEVIPSAFRLILKVPGPAAFAAQTTQIVATMMNFVQLDLEEFTDTRSTGWGRGVPLYIAPHTAATVIGFFQAVLEVRQGTPVNARYTDVRRDGTSHGFDTVAIRYEFDWGRG